MIFYHDDDDDDKNNNSSYFKLLILLLLFVISEPSSLYALFHLILTRVIENRCRYYCSTDEKTDAQSMSNLSKGEVSFHNILCC